MSVQTDPVPPAPQHTPPREIDEKLPSGKEKAQLLFSQPWIRWFISLRDKINVLNESLVNLGDVSGNGLLAKNGAAWLTRVLTGTSSRVTVSNGDGASGNPIVDVVTSDLVAGTNVTFTGSGVGRIIGNSSLTINASGGGGGGGADLSARIMGLTPAAFYKMNEASGTTLVDSSGNGLNGTYVGGFTLGQASMIPGNTDTCVQFNGTTGYANIGQPAALNYASGNTFTVFCLVNYSTYNPTSGASVTKATTTSRLAQIDIGTNCIFWRSGATAINPTALGTPGVNFPGIVIPVTLVRRYTNSTHYLEAWANGQLVDRASITHENPAADWLVGARRTTDNSTTGNFINGKIQYVAIFSRDLTAPEIRSLHNAVNL